MFVNILLDSSWNTSTVSWEAGEYSGLICYHLWGFAFCVQLPFTQKLTMSLLTHESTLSLFQ